MDKRERQQWLLERLATAGEIETLIAAEQCNVSATTIGRDLRALEQLGALKRTRNGARCTQMQTPPFTRRSKSTHWLSLTREQCCDILDGAQTLFIDGGTSGVNFARHLPLQFAGLVITPAPAVACALLELEIETLLIGGSIRPLAAIATGQGTLHSIAKYRADLCILGACALDSTFGLSADDSAEAAVKHQMAAQSARTVVLAQSTKLNRRARYGALDAECIYGLITDASATTEDLRQAPWKTWISAHPHATVSRAD